MREGAGYKILEAATGPALDHVCVDNSAWAGLQSGAQAVSLYCRVPQVPDQNLVRKESAGSSTPMLNVDSVL